MTFRLCCGSSDNTWRAQPMMPRPASTPTARFSTSLPVPFIRVSPVPERSRDWIDPLPLRLTSSSARSTISRSASSKPHSTRTTAPTTMWPISPTIVTRVVPPKSLLEQEDTQSALFVGAILGRQMSAFDLQRDAHATHQSRRIEHNLHPAIQL